MGGVLVLGGVFVLFCVLCLCFGFFFSLFGGCFVCLVVRHPTCVVSAA